MSRQQQMVILSVIYGVTLAVLAMTTTGVVGVAAVIGGAIVGLGWAFYANDRSDRSDA